MEGRNGYIQRKSALKKESEVLMRIVSEELPDGVEGTVTLIRSLLEHPPKYNCISCIDGKIVLNPFTGELHNETVYLKFRASWIKALQEQIDILSVGAFEESTKT